MNRAPPHDDSRCWAYCRPIADAIREGLEGVGEVTLRHPPYSAPVTAFVRIEGGAGPGTSLGIFIHLPCPIWTVEDAQAQLPELRYHIARALEMAADIPDDERGRYREEEPADAR